MVFGQIDFTQASTIRGAVWVIGGIIGIIAAFTGNDPTEIILVTSAVAGGLGVAIRD